MTTCASCGNPEHPHNFRHPFVPMPSSKTNWPQRFMDLAQYIAQWSKDPSTKVGAVIIDEKRRLVGEGYNGFPRGVEDTEERLNDRPLKYSLVVHAEANAILSATRADLEGCVLYVTHLPCSGCAKLIIQSGIRVVFVPSDNCGISAWQEDQDGARAMLKEAGVTIMTPMQ